VALRGSGQTRMKRILFIVVIVLVFLAGWLAWEWITFPDIDDLRTENPASTAFMDQRRELLRDSGKSDAIAYTFVPYDRISPYLRRAVLVSEDSAFYDHDGVDVEGVKEAARRDWKNKKLSHGGSTITQQLAKNLYLSPSRNPLRKAREYLIARQLEEKLTKKRILELYLNVVEMGERVYGAEAASRFYFQKGARSLTPREAALLAGCLPNPRVMSPGKPNGRLRARQKIILSRMRRWGYLFEKEVLTEKKKSAPRAPVPDTVATATTETLAEPEITESIDESVPEEPVVEPPVETPAPELEPPPPTDTTTTPDPSF